MFSSRPSETRRRTTDIPCCGIFILAVGVFAGLLVYAEREGNPHLILGLRDADGQVCGADFAVKNQPYLYLCPDASNNFFMNAGHCVEACPGLASEKTPCPKGYASLPSETNICLPAGQSADLLSKMESSELSGAIALSHLYTNLFRAWPLLLIAAPLLSAAIGCAYLRFLKAEAQVVFWVSFIVVVACLSVAGVYYLQEYDRRRNNQDHEDDEAANGDLLYGIVGTSLAVLTILGACLSRDSIRISFPYLEAAGECLADMPPLMIQPVVETLKKMLLLSLFLYSASRLLSLRLALDNLVFALVALFFVVVFFWLVEVMGSLSRYVLGFLTEEFVFSPYDARNDSKQVPPYVTSEAYKSALVYHFGSLCLGSIANVALKPLRTILRIVTAPTRFGCCLIAFQGMTDFQGRLAAYSDAAYLAMALDGHSYFEATQDSLQMLGAEGQLEAAWLDSTLLEVQLLGTVASASLVAVIVRIMARSMWTFSNVGSELYVEDDGAVAFAAFIVALLCSWCFMESVGFVADALIFSFRAQSKGYLGLTAMVSERAALCEVPDCISVDRRGQPAALNPFTSYPPKLTQLLTFVNNRRGGYGFGLTDSSTSRGYGGYGGYSQASSGWSTPR